MSKTERGFIFSDITNTPSSVLLSLHIHTSLAAKSIAMKTRLFLLFTFIGFALGAQTYHWRHINAQANVYEQVPGNSTHIFAGDAAGFIKKSSNSGQDWEIVYRGDASSIYDVKFIDTHNGFATCADQGLFLTTTDAGQTWKQNIMLDSANNAVTERFHSVEIIDANTLIINGTFNSGKRAFISTDKGASFTELHVPGTAIHVEGDTLLAFGQNGFSFGISLSTDLGQSWTLVKSNPALGSNNFYYNGYKEASIISSKVFFLSSNDLNPDGVFRTTDGGLTFTMLTDPANNFHPNYVNFSSATTGTIAGKISSAGFGFFSTTDAGQTWTPLYSASGYATQLTPPFLNLGNNTILGQRYFHSVISTDGGLTFTDNSDDFNPVGTFSHQNIEVVDNQNLYAHTITGTGTYAKRQAMLSNDGGMNWYNMKDSTGTLLENTFANMQVISKDTVMYTYGNAIRRFVKNGTGSGRTVYSKTGFGSGIAKMVKSGNRLLAFTSSYVYYSSDRGASWQSMYSALNTNDNKDIQFTDFSNIYALQSNQILKSTDTGKTWLDVTNGISLGTSANNGTAGMVVKSTSEIIIFGYNGRLYRTTDGGQNWTDLKPTLPQTPVDLRFYDFEFMEFKDNMIGYAGDRTANGGRYILQTLDGGLTWSHFTSGQYMVVPHDMDFADTATGIMMGGSGPNVIRYFSDINYSTDTISANGQPASGVSLAENRNTSVSLYPNPAYHHCTVSGCLVFNAYLISLQGKKISLPEVRNNNIELSGIAPGMYILIIEDEQKQTFTHKLMVQ